MSWIGWAACGLGVLFVIAFVICCPDLLPWNRRRRK